MILQGRPLVEREFHPAPVFIAATILPAEWDAPRLRWGALLGCDVGLKLDRVGAAVACDFGKGERVAQAALVCLGDLSNHEGRIFRTNGPAGNLQHVSGHSERS